MNERTLKGAKDESGDSPAGAMSTRQLLGWMFQFLSPVKTLVVICAIYLVAVVAIDVLTNRQAGQAVDQIKTVFERQAWNQPAAVWTLDASARHLADDISAVRGGFWAWALSGRQDASAIRAAVVLLLVLVLLMGVFRYLREVANSKMSMQMVFYLRQAVYDKLQRVGWGFHDSVSSGQLINRALSDLQNVRQFIQTAVLTSLEIVLYVLLNIILIASINPWVALLSLVPLPIWTWYILRFSKKVQPAAKAVMEAEDRNVSLITESIAGVHVIKAFATEGQEIKKYNANCESFRERVLKRIRLFANFQPVVRLIASASHLSLFLLAGLLIIFARQHGWETALTVGDLLVLSGAMNQILGRLQQVSTINEQYQNAIVSARRLYEVLNAPSTVPEKDGARELARGSGRVAFAGVTFGYNADKPVLHDISFDVAGGSVVAVVGPTGAGKTTLVNLIARFYDPQHGAVRLDGEDLRDLRLDSIRPEVGFVFQETYLFSDTVAGNIAYGRPNITRGEIEAAARLAQAHDFIAGLTGHYDHLLGERGSSLSGGQRQRLAIARAIVTNPRVLVLDDATASVDPETEDLIRRGMRLVMHGRTTFIIAHRISTVKQADVVLVIEQGRITQMGTHEELMRQGGHYQDIAAVQLSGDDEQARKRLEESPSHMKRIAGRPGDVTAAKMEATGDERDHLASPIQREEATP